MRLVAQQVFSRPPALVTQRLRRRCQAANGLSWSEARFDGATVTLPDAIELTSFAAQLDDVMASVRNANRKGVWMRVPLSQGGVLPLAAAHGFRFHHAVGESAMLLAWLPEDEPCPVPDFATHVVGVGGMCINERHEVLVVQERRAATTTSQGSWKLPGGLVDLAEELDVAVEREVLEETGVRSRFKSLLALRHQHGAAFGRDDAYCACLLSPLSAEIRACEREIAAAAWLPLPEYYEGTKATSARQGVEENFNAFVARNVIAAAEAGNLDGAAIGLAAREMPAPKGYLPGVTGLTNRETYRLYSGFH